MLLVVLQTIAAAPPLLSAKVAYRNPKAGLGGGISQKKLASEAYRAIGGVAHFWRSSGELFGVNSDYSVEARKFEAILGKSSGDSLLDWTLSWALPWALPWTPSWDVSWGLS